MPAGWAPNPEQLPRVEAVFPEQPGGGHVEFGTERFGVGEGVLGAQAHHGQVI
jgi:hypothetical protein